MTFLVLGATLMTRYLLLLIQTLDGGWLLTVLLACGLLGFILAVALCRYLLDCLSAMFEGCCDWLEIKLSRRKVRRRSLMHLQRMARHSRPVTTHLPASNPQPRLVAVKSVAQQPPAQKQSVAIVLPYQARRPVSARDALRRSCIEQ